MKKVGLFFGGMGNEAEVSIISAQNVAENFDHKKYKLILIYWHKNGSFYKLENFSQVKKPKNKIEEENFKKFFDIALPMTHGKYGEDGILQAIFERHKVPYCGCRVLSSAICMDKAICKKYLETEKIDQVKFDVIDFGVLSEKEIKEKINRIKKIFKFPLFVKPANSGSSVGITNVKKASALKKAIENAKIHDSKIVIEEAVIKPKEIEIAILGNGKLAISRPGELSFSNEFYDYDEKYKNNKTEVIIPAKLDKEIEKKIVEMAKRVYKLYNCRGFARLDFFVSKNKIYFNEINTLPGFTKFSMYPMLMMHTGMSYKDLINKIIELAY